MAQKKEPSMSQSAAGTTAASAAVDPDRVIVSNFAEAGFDADHPIEIVGLPLSVVSATYEYVARVFRFILPRSSRLHFVFGRKIIHLAMHFVILLCKSIQ